MDRKRGCSNAEKLHCPVITSKCNHFYRHFLYETDMKYFIFWPVVE